MSTGNGASLFLIMEHRQMPISIAVLCLRLQFRLAELKAQMHLLPSTLYDVLSM
jgi:hypothetical protein